MYVDTAKLAASVHGELGVGCVECHVGLASVKDFPHPASRLSRKDIVPVCGECHTDVRDQYLAGVHGADYARGVVDVPVCTDCHSGHDMRRAKDPASSVYAARIGAVCSRCHDDERLSRRYGFQIARLETYESSFHGTAIKFGETRVANCASCHGFHEILPSSDPRSSVAPANLPKTCGKCHAGAGRNFAKGKMHGSTGGPANPPARVVKSIYIVLIATMSFLFLVYITADIIHGVKRS